MRLSAKDVVEQHFVKRAVVYGIFGGLKNPFPGQSFNYSHIVFSVFSFFVKNISVFSWLVA